MYCLKIVVQCPARYAGLEVHMTTVYKELNFNEVIVSSDEDYIQQPKNPVKLKESVRVFKFQEKLNFNDSGRPAKVARPSRSILVKDTMELVSLFDWTRELAAREHSRGSVADALVRAVRHILANYSPTITQTIQECLRSADGLAGLSDLKRVLRRSRGLKRLLKDIGVLLVASSSTSSLSSLLDLVAEHIPKAGSPLTDIFLACSRPLLEMISNWIKFGVLLDCYGEFFISYNPRCLETHFWHHQFILRDHLIPNMVPWKLAEIILETGKTIVFMREYCGEEPEIISTSELMSKLGNLDSDKETWATLLTSENNQIDELFKKSHEETRSALLNIMVNKYQLLQHFEVLYNYILLNKGDFVWCLMKLINKEMNKNVTGLHDKKLKNLLKSAIENSSAANDNLDTTEMISIRFKKALPDDFLEDVFGLHYEMKGPFKIVFQMTENKYDKIFQFLWKAKLMDFHLSEIWINVMLISRSELNIKGLRSFLSEIFVLCSNLMHFNKQLQNYIAYDVLEKYWLEFLNKYYKATSLDDVINSHAKFLNSVSLEITQDETSQHLPLQLNVIFSLVYDLQALVNQLGLITEMIRNGEHIPKKAYSTIKANVLIITKNYEAVIGSFVCITKSFHCYDGLRLLAEKIDYNFYYSKKYEKIMKPKQARKQKIPIFTHSSKENDI